jgi:hypothetical protein
MIREKAVTDLAIALMLQVRTHYQLGPTNRDRVYEVLNALGVVTATVLQGADGAAADAERFFQQALRQQLAGLVDSGDDGGQS